MDAVATPGSRRLPWILLAGGLGGTGLNWYFALGSQRFYPKLAVVAPLGLAVGLAFLLAPSLAGKAAPGQTRKVVLQVAVVVAGLGLGFLNLWLLSRG